MYPLISISTQAWIYQGHDRNVILSKNYNLGLQFRITVTMYDAKFKDVGRPETFFQLQ